jgi:hypothetical protein
VGRTVSERAGVIVVRVWIERDAAPLLRARITASADLSSDERTIGACAGIEDTLEAVREWLEGFSRCGCSTVGGPEL